MADLICQEAVRSETAAAEWARKHYGAPITARHLQRLYGPQRRELELAAMARRLLIPVADYENLVTLAERLVAEDSSAAVRVEEIGGRTPLRRWSADQLRKLLEPPETDPN